MPKNVRRATFTHTITYTFTTDFPGYPEETDTNLLTLAGGAAGNTGILSVGDLLAGSIAASGVLSKGNWSVTGTSVNVESYISRPQNTALTVGRRVASVSPPTGYTGATAKMYFVEVAGTTANSATEPNWSMTDGGQTTDGTVTYRTLPRYPSFANFAVSTAYTLGQMVRPSGTSLKEYVVTVAGTSAASAPTWTNADNYAETITSGGVTFMSVTDCAVVGDYSLYALGDLVKTAAGSNLEFICTVAGTTGASASTALGAISVGATVTNGTATFKRVV